MTIKTLILILTLSIPAIAGMFAEVVSDDTIKGHEDHDVFSTVIIYQHGDTITVEHFDPIYGAAKRIDYIGKFKKVVVKGTIKKIPEHNEVEWKK